MRRGKLSGIFWCLSGVVFLCVGPLWLWAGEKPAARGEVKKEAKKVPLPRQARRSPSVRRPCAGSPKNPKSQRGERRAKPTPRGTSPCQKFLEQVRRQVQAVYLVQSQLYWVNWVYGEEINLAPTYVGREAIFSQATLRRLNRELKRATSPRQKMALRYLRSFVAEEIISRTITPIKDQVNNLEANSWIVVDSQRYPYRQHRGMLANEADYQRRRRIHQACSPVFSRLNPLLQKKEEITRALAKKLGFRSYIHFSEELRGFSLKELVRVSQAFLASTDQLNRQTLARLIRSHMGLPLAKFGRSDILRFFKLVRFEQYFPVSRMLPSVKGTLTGIGVDLDRQSNIKIHSARLPKKNPRAICLPVSVPEDIRLSIKPVGGWNDWHALLHEIGNALHYANSKTKTFEFQHLGSKTVSEAYAFLFSSLMANRYWIEQYTALRGKELWDYLEFMAFKKLYMVRRYSAKVHFEYLWHRGAKNPRKLYRKHLSRAYGFTLNDIDSLGYLIDHDDYFYSAEYLRAWFLEAQLAEYLVRRFGKRWFANPKAGAFLRTLWAKGQTLTGEAMARLLGYKGINSKALLRRLSRILQPGSIAAPKPATRTTQPAPPSKPSTRQPATR